MRNGEIACYKQFLLFSQCFQKLYNIFFHFKCTLKCHLQIFFNLDQSKILSSGNRLKGKMFFYQIDSNLEQKPYKFCTRKPHHGFLPLAVELLLHIIQ